MFSRIIGNIFAFGVDDNMLKYQDRNEYVWNIYGSMTEVRLEICGMSMDMPQMAS